MITLLLIVGIVVDIVVFVLVMEYENIPTKYALGIVWLLYTLLVAWCISKYLFIYLNGGLLW